MFLAHAFDAMLADVGSNAVVFLCHRDNLGTVLAWRAYEGAPAHCDAIDLSSQHVQLPDVKPAPYVKRNPTKPLLIKGVPRTFRGKVVAEWLADGRRMKLAEDFWYFDDRGVGWMAPKGAVVDGASIPSIAWSAIGGPFEGLYRNASVIHDVACERKDRPWQMVHEVFYSAMITSGVPPSKALYMYAAVYHFGPAGLIRTVSRSGTRQPVANG